MLAFNKGTTPLCTTVHSTSCKQEHDVIDVSVKEVTSYPLPVTEVWATDFLGQK